MRFAGGVEPCTRSHVSDTGSCTDRALLPKSGRYSEGERRDLASRGQRTTSATSDWRRWPCLNGATRPHKVSWIAIRFQVFVVDDYRSYGTPTHSVLLC